MSFPLFPPPLILSVDAYGVVPAGVSPPCPFGARPPARQDSFSWPSAWQTKRPLWPPHGEQKGRYDPARETKRPLWPPHGEQKGRYAPVGVRPPPPLRGSSPCKAGQFIPAGFDCRHSEVCKSRSTVSLNSLNSFFQMVLNPQECGLFRNPSGSSSHLPCKAEEFCLRPDRLFAATDLTFCYFPEDLTLCYLKPPEIHLYGAGGGGGRKKRSLAECAEAQMSANRGYGLSFCRGCGLFPRRDCRGT